MNTEGFQDMVSRKERASEFLLPSALQPVEYIRHFKLLDRATKHKVLRSKLTPIDFVNMESGFFFSIHYSYILHVSNGLKKKSQTP